MCRCGRGSRGSSPLTWRPDLAPQNRSPWACRRAVLSSGERWIRRTGLRQAQPERKKKNMTTAASSTFVNIGERTNVTGSAAFKKLILADDYAAAVEVERQQVENGAQVIDVNMAEGLPAAESAWTPFTNTTPPKP